LLWYVEKKREERKRKREKERRDISETYHHLSFFILSLSLSLSLCFSFSSFLRSFLSLLSFFPPPFTYSSITVLSSYLFPLGICFWAHNTAKVSPKIPRTASQMYHGHGKPTKCRPSRLSDCKPGDLLFYCYPGRPCPNHVNMYIGNGKIADCPRTGLDCRILKRVSSPSAFYGSRTYCR
jgi:hypothetical protein